MSETRKIAAILVADIVGYSRLAGADEDRILARLRALRSDLIDPTIAVHHGRVVKRTGDGSLIEFRSVVDAVRCAIEVQNGLIERNAGLPPERRIEFRVGIHLGDVVEEADGDLMGDGVNIAARLEGIAAPGAICLSEDAYRQVSGRLDMAVTDLGPTQLKNIERSIRVYSLQVGVPAQAKPATEAKPARAEKAFVARAARARVRRVGRIDRGWRLVFSRRGPTGDRRSNGAASRASFHRGAALRKSLRRSSQDYFADGITENLTTDLSRIRDSFVIARNTAFTFKGKAIDAKEIGKELGVRYVLEGSVQRDQNRVRVNAQLIDAAVRRASLGRPFRGRPGRSIQVAGSGGGAIGQCVGLRTGPGGSRSRRTLEKPRFHRSRHARLGRDEPVGAAAADEGHPRRSASLVRPSARDRPERRRRAWRAKPTPI